MIYEELKARGLIYQTTDEEKLKNKLLPPLKKKFQQVKDYSNGQKSNTKEK